MGGIIIELLDRFPAEGEEVVTESGIRLTAKKVNNNRIELVNVLLPVELSIKDEEENISGDDNNAPAD